ncbi:MAG: diacylglycerol kinase family protein [Acidobacteriota bacterium]
MRPALLIYNPASGQQRSRERVPALIRALSEAGFEAQEKATEGPGHAQHLAREAVGSGTQVVFSFGGDGTLREVAKGLIGSSLALACLPGGTANVLARYWGIPRHAETAAVQVGSWQPREMDVGLTLSACGREECFLMMASCGLDGAVLRRPLSRSKARWGPAAVAAAGLREWWQMNAAATLRLEVEGQQRNLSFFSVCNIPLYGGPFRLAPEARCDDRRLDLVTFSGKGRWTTMALAAAVVTGRHLRRRDVALEAAENVELQAPQHPPIQLDGDAIDLQAPIRFELHPQRLNVLAPISPG